MSDPSTDRPINDAFRVDATAGSDTREHGTRDGRGCPIFT